jgi:SNF2 family DNA or RNA helicase
MLLIKDKDPEPLWDGFEYKPHQKSAIAWMLFKESSEMSGGLLCDEMGLGKTMEILGTIKNSKKMQTLLLCPKAVISQWRSAATKSSFNVLELVDGGWIMSSSFNTGQPFLFVTNYDKLSKSSAFTQRFWDRIVLDEAHRVRNKNGNLWNGIHSLSKKTMWCVTATPLVNNLKDVHSLFMLIGYEQSKLADYTYLCDLMHTSCMHRSMDEMRPVLKELPAAPSITKIVVEFTSEEEANFYQGIQGKILKRWKALESDQSKQSFVLLMRLRQLSLHPQVYIGARKREPFGYSRDCWTGTSTKFSAMEKLLADEVKPKRCIIFCQLKDEMNLIENELMDKYTVLQYHGGLSEEQKATVLKESEGDLGGKHMVFLVNIKSGGVGLNLQHFTHIIFMSPWWTAALMDQAIGRAVRIGQKEVVEVILLALKEEETLNIDETMLKKVDEKRSMLSNIFLHASRGFDVQAAA